MKGVDILMRSTEDRLTRMHERAAAIKRQEDKSRLRILGSLSAGLMVCLVIVMQQLQSMHHEIYEGQTTGTSLLDDSTGGYVLAAVLAFIAGVVVTAVIYRFRRKKGNDGYHKR